MAGWQKSAAPKSLQKALIVVFTGPVRDQNNKRWQIVGLTAQSITQPGPKRRTPRLLRTSLNKRNGRVVIDRLCVHGPDQADIVHNPRRVRQEFTDPCARLPRLMKFEFRSDYRKALLTGCHARQSLAMPD